MQITDDSQSRRTVPWYGIAYASLHFSTVKLLYLRSAGSTDDEAHGQSRRAQISLNIIAVEDGFESTGHDTSRIRRADTPDKRTEDGE